MLLPGTLVLWVRNRAFKKVPSRPVSHSTISMSLLSPLIQQPNKNIDAYVSDVNIHIKTSGKVKRKLEHINDDVRILGIVLEEARLVPVLYREHEYRLFCSSSSPRLIFHQDAGRTTTSTTILSESFVWDNGEYYLR